MLQMPKNTFNRFSFLLFSLISLTHIPSFGTSINNGSMAIQELHSGTVNQSHSGRIIGFLGIFVMLAIAFALSNNRKKFSL